MYVVVNLSSPVHVITRSKALEYMYHVSVVVGQVSRVIFCEHRPGGVHHLAWGTPGSGHSTDTGVGLSTDTLN